MALSVAAGVAAYPLWQVPFLQPLPIHVGEVLTYDVRLGPLSAGEQTLHVVREAVHRGRSVYVVESRSTPSDLLSRVYHFRDFKRSYIDADTFFPLRYEKRIEDRSYRGNFIVEFDRAAHRASVWRDGVRQNDIAVPEAVQDELSMAYSLRMKNLRAGERYAYTFFTGTTVIPVEVQVVRQEYYGDGPAALGKVRVHRLEASDGFGFWITADRHRIPVRIEAPVRVKALGKMVAVLRSWERPRVSPSGAR
jgi:hypothetical protein